MHKLFITIMTSTTLVLAGCGPTQQPHHPRHHQTKVYTFSDGRTGYQDPYGIWWYMTVMDSGTRTVYVNSNPSSSTSGVQLGLSGTQYGTASFTRGSAPSEDEIESAVSQEVEATNVSQAQEMGQEPVEAEAIGGTPEGETAASASTSESGTTSSESSSSSSSSDSGGGGGDSGGGSSD